MTIRRVITGHDKDMKAVVIDDGPAGNTRTPVEGLASTDSTPADITSDEDMGARVIGTPPPPLGTRFCVHEIQPNTTGTSTGARALHRTDTTDYVIVIQGRLLMMLDEDDVELGHGDVVIMRGTNHGWCNIGDEVCKVAFVLTDAEKVYVPGAPART